MSQNLLLTESALGLGGWPFGGFNAQITLGGTPMCRGLGFRFETASRGSRQGMPYPIGKDGVFETHHPHYFDGSVDAMVDQIIGKLLEKDRDLRYAGARELMADLKLLRRDSESGRAPRIAERPVAARSSC